MSGSKMNSRRLFLKQFGLGGIALLTSGSIVSCLKSKNKPNVLFILVDDLRPQLGCYGYSEIKTPNIDQIANEGMVFQHAYCQEPICMASRASLLTGYRPDFNMIYNCKSVKDLVPDALTMNRYFENQGYQVCATGKVYHHKEDVKEQFGDRYINTDQGWIGRGYITKESEQIVNDYKDAFPKLRSGKPSEGRGPAFEAADVEDNKYWDGARTDAVIKKLKALKGQKQPFFMAVGYRKPHLPFNAPKKYWDMYSRENLKLADNPYLPKSSTEYTAYNFEELRNYYGIPKDQKLLPNELALTLIHGYYACVSYVDAQIGKVLDTLDNLGMRKNTIIVLWGDHGWKLGEHGMWCKHTPFELDARVPMIFSIPGMKHAGKSTEALSETVDIYPTLCELCGLEKPPHLEGSSLVPVLENPEIAWKEAAFTQWPKLNRKNPDKVVTAYSMKNDRYRYTEWIRNKTGEILANELYDHKTDSHENCNIADLPENEQLVKQLSKQLMKGKGWKKFRLENS